METTEKAVEQIRAVRTADRAQADSGRDPVTRKPIFVSYATPEYADLAQDLERDLHDLNLDYAITYYSDQPTWRAACGRKAQFIMAQLREFRRPVIWLDADSRIKLYPILLVEDYVDDAVDFACWFSMSPKTSRHPFGDPKKEILNSGTMFWAYSFSAMDLLDDWIEAEHGQYEMEQRVLGEVWYMFGHDIRWERLPQRYCKIRGMPWQENEAGPTVIENLVYSLRGGRR